MFRWFVTELIILLDSNSLSQKYFGSLYDEIRNGFIQILRTVRYDTFGV